ncbi:MAG TPA: hypothetical protein DCR24_04840 [Bacillus bacterium]|nr:hypothetical protein [Bacillus sp. (in: firmicutes)]
MRKKHSTKWKLIVLLIVIIFVFIFAVRFLFKSPESQAKLSVSRFYTYEQEGNFSDSWSMFHPFMKQKFPKASFIQDRAHVFIGHFGADTFTFKVGDAKEVSGWKAAKGEAPFKSAYKFVVTQNYKGKYGKFSFNQDVYVVQIKEDWLILWDYTQ